MEKYEYSSTEKTKQRRNTLATRFQRVATPTTKSKHARTEDGKGPHRLGAGPGTDRQSKTGEALKTYCTPKDFGLRVHSPPSYKYHVQSEEHWLQEVKDNDRP